MVDKLRLPRQTIVLITAVFGFIFLFFVVQSLGAMGFITALSQEDDDVPTEPTPLLEAAQVDDALGAYIRGSIAPSRPANAEELAYMINLQAQNQPEEPVVIVDQVVPAPFAAPLGFTPTFTVYMPIIYNPFEPLTLSATRPNSSNQWDVSWSTGSGNVAEYELEESNTVDFASATVTVFTVGTNISNISEVESVNNVYYYRVRSTGGNVVGPWSNVVEVRGAYFDDFTNNQTGWSSPDLKGALRRLTYIEKSDSFYENNELLILRVEDSWDWALVSPLAKAPEPPYAIQYRTQIANLGNLVSHGVVFGGDWNGEACPDYATFSGLYFHKRCFNHFYNTNLIWYDPIKLAFERVDYLEWRPQDGGSPLKRGSFDDYASWFVIDSSLSKEAAKDWVTYRIEVRDTGIKMFANGNNYANTSDTLWINDPYFGFFASTDEYSNSTQRFDYVYVRPLDS